MSYNVINAADVHENKALCARSIGDDIVDSYVRFAINFSY